MSRLISIAGAWIVSWSVVVGFASAQCPGDCNNDGSVTINELVKGVQMVLRRGRECEALDTDGNCVVSVAELVTGVNSALAGCSLSPTTPTPTADPNSTTTPTVSSAGTGFAIDGCVNEFPGSPCGAMFATVCLAPLRLSSTLGPDRRFHFADIPPGEYVLSVIEGCNPFGCWDVVPVTVVDQSLFVHMDLIPRE